MKIIYVILTLLTVFLVAGCQTEAPAQESAQNTAPPAAPEAAESEAEVEAPTAEELVEEAKAAEEVPESDSTAADIIESSDISEKDKATLLRYQEQCDRGNVGLCVALDRLKENLEMTE